MSGPKPVALSTKKAIIRNIYSFFLDSASLSNHLIAHFEAATYTVKPYNFGPAQILKNLKTNLCQLQTAASSPELGHLPTDANLYLYEEDDKPFMENWREPPRQQSPGSPPALQA